MVKAISIVVMVLFFAGCKPTAVTAPPTVEATTPSFEYKQQEENREKGIYFRANGNEPDWNLKIGEKTIEFTSLKPGFETFNSEHAEPIRAMDANVKLYRITTEAGKMFIRISQEECSGTMADKKYSYAVQIDMTINDIMDTFKGCGNYITDYRLHDIWVLEKLNGVAVTSADFSKELPNLEINSQANTFMGYAGCNRMNGGLFFEKGLLRFTKVITTRKACPENNKEAEFLKTLQSTTQYKVENLRLTLKNRSGAELVFRKID